MGNCVSSSPTSDQGAVSTNKKQKEPNLKGKQKETSVKMPPTSLQLSKVEIPIPSQSQTTNQNRNQIEEGSSPDSDKETKRKKTDPINIFQAKNDEISSTGSQTTDDSPPLTPIESSPPPLPPKTLKKSTPDLLTEQTDEGTVPPPAELEDMLERLQIARQGLASKSQTTAQTGTEVQTQFSSSSTFQQQVASTRITSHSMRTITSVQERSNIQRFNSPFDNQLSYLTEVDEEDRDKATETDAANNMIRYSTRGILERQDNFNLSGIDSTTTTVAATSVQRSQVKVTSTTTDMTSHR